MQPSFLLEQGGARWLIDCGATTLTALQQQEIDPATLETIVLSHLHGDHFAGLVWVVLHGMFLGQRQTPLRVIGPPGTQERFETVFEAFYPGVTSYAPPFEMTYETIDAGQKLSVGDRALEAFAAVHPSGAPSLALRMGFAGKTLSYSGDTEWTEDLIACADGADLFVCECYSPSRPIKNHLNWPTLSARLPEITARKILITHMSSAMLAAVPELRQSADERVAFAEDGLSLTL